MNSIVVKNQYQLTKWSAIIKECNDSGIKIKDWLKANNISKDQYYYWRRKLQEYAIDSIDTAFVEVPLSTAPSVNNSYSMSAGISIADSARTVIASVHLANASIDIYNNTSPETLKVFLEVFANA